MTLQEVTDNIIAANENIYLAYAFNGTGKTRLSVNLKDTMKLKDGSHQGVYYNAYNDDIGFQHFAFLRQLLETISSFLSLG